MLNKKIISIGVIVVICAVVIIAIASFKKDGNKNNRGNENDGDKNNFEMEKVIDEYFEAINDKDLDAIYDVGYPKFVKEQIADKDKLNSINLLDFYTNPMSIWSLGFTRGLYDTEYFRIATKDSYPNVDQGLSEEEVETQTLSMLNIKYNILDIQPFEELNVMGRTVMGDEELSFEDIESRLYKKDIKTGDVMYDIQFEDLYIAVLDIEWSYGDMLYGMDMNWWNDVAISTALRDNVSNNTYESAISNMETYDDNIRVYVLFLYQYDGNWYIVEPEKLGTMKGKYINKTITRDWY